MEEGPLDGISEKYRHIIAPKIDWLRGVTRIALILEDLAVRSHCIKEGDAYISKHHGFKMKEKADFRYYIREKEVVEQIEEEIQNDSVFVDIGSFHGFYSLLARSLTDSKVYAFEMDRENLKELKSNIELNDRSGDVIVENKAVWDEEEEIPYMASENGSRAGMGDETVKAVTLDNYFSDKENPDVIKMDAEGAELKVLKGSEKLLEDGSTKWIIEIHHGDRYTNFDHSYTDIKEFLEEKGYTLKKLRDRPQETIILAQKT